MEDKMNVERVERSARGEMFWETKSEDVASEEDGAKRNENENASGDARNRGGARFRFRFPERLENILLQSLL